MKPIIIIAIAVGIGAIITIIAGSSIQNQDIGMDETKPWLSLSCDGMLDFSASPEHQNITDEQHMEFHNYYFDNCSDTESGKP